MPLSFFNNAGGSYGAAVPFQRIVEPQQLGMFLNLEQAELLRIQRYNEAWRFYYGKHWIFDREDGDPLVTFNYFRKFIDKHVEFLCSKGFVIGTHDALEEVTKPYLDEVWEYNNRDVLMKDICTMGGITGDVFVLVTDEEPTEIQKKINPHSQGKTRINLHGSEQVFPTWDPLNHQTLTAVRIETVYYAERGVNQIDKDDRMNHEGRQLYIKRFTQIITPNAIVEQFHGQQPIVKPNLLGEIPLVHWPNISIPKEYYGLPDGQDLIDLNRELNEKSTDISDIINYHSAPITVITGAKAKDLHRDVRQIWSGLPADANVFNLKLEGDLTAAQNYWEKVKLAMHELGDIPEGTLGKQQPISNTSGVALHQMYQPLVGHRDTKLPTYQSGVQQINYFILRIGMLKGRINLPFDICKSCGGRILELPTGELIWKWHPDLNDYIQVPGTRKRCFRINKQTLDFEKPENLKVKIWREYGFGGVVKEVTLSEAERIASGAVSFWDYAYREQEAMDKYTTEIQAVRDRNLQRQKEAANQPQSAPMDAEGNIGPAPPPAMEAEPPPPIPKVKRLPMGDVDVPEEPETIELMEPLLHPVSGHVIRIVSKTVQLVPCGCDKPSYLNPFENKVTFNDVLPKDEALESDLFQKWLQMRIVDTEWVQDQIPRIAVDKRMINQRLKAQATSGMPQPYTNALMPGAPQSPPITDLTPAVPPQASVPGQGGNPVPQGMQGGQG